MDHSSDAIIFVDPDDRIRVWNDAAEALFGIDGAEFENDPRVRKCVALSPDQQQANFDVAGVAIRSSVRIPAKSGGEDQQVDRCCQPFEVDDKSWWLVTLSRTPPRSPTESEIYKLAQTDSLSGLFNRRGFQSALEGSLDQQLVLAIIDVDFFKQINDQHGHGTGDQAIQWLARHLNEAFPDAIGVGRLGGDEFGVVLAGADRNSIAMRFDEFCETVLADSKTWYPDGISISVGVAIARRRGVTARELLTMADRALYKSKRGGRNRVSLVEV